MHAFAGAPALDLKAHLLLSNLPVTELLMTLRLTTLQIA